MGLLIILYTTHKQLASLSAFFGNTQMLQCPDFACHMHVKGFCSRAPSVLCLLHVSPRFYVLFHDNVKNSDTDGSDPAAKAAAVSGLLEKKIAAPLVRVQTALAKETVLWKRGILVMPKVQPRSHPPSPHPTPPHPTPSSLPSCSPVQGIAMVQYQAPYLALANRSLSHLLKLYFPSASRVCASMCLSSGQFV